MKKKGIIITIIIVASFLLLSVIGMSVYYITGMGPVDPLTKENITFTVNKGEAANTIIDNLKKSGLIKNDLVMKIYVKFNPGTPIAGDYILTKSMSVKEIYNAILSGKVSYDTIWVTFVEGKRLDYIADVISQNFSFSKENILAKMDDKVYITTLISKYSFLTDDILNENIYHPLEGYLFPDTYEFLSNVTIEEIIERMLDNTESKLSVKNEIIESNDLSIHQIMTLASLVELEGARSTDRAGVAGVFYNRLKNGMTLGSDVTTYYAVGKNFDVDLTNSDLASCNGYNTRGNCVTGLPVGPIASSSLESIEAVLNPKEHDYYFFVADKNGKTYFNKTNAEHDATVRQLKAENLWYEY